MADKIYFFPHTRFQPFGFGMLLGFWLDGQLKKPPNQQWGVNWRHVWLVEVILFYLALACIALPMFVTAPLYSSFPEPGWTEQWKNSFYLGFSKVCWSIGISLLAVVCVFPLALWDKEPDVNGGAWQELLKYFPSSRDVSDRTHLPM